MQEPRVRDPLDLLTPIRIHPDLMVPFQGEVDSLTFGKEKRAIDSRFVEKQFTSEDYEKYIANDVAGNLSQLSLWRQELVSPSHIRAR